MNLFEKTSNNKDLPMKNVNKKKDSKGIKIEKPITSISLNHISIV